MGDRRPDRNPAQVSDAGEERRAPMDLSRRRTPLAPFDHRSPMLRFTRAVVPVIPSRQLVFPDPQHPPAARFQRPADQPVTPAIGIQLCLPERSILHGHVGVGWAGVPETAVDEDREFESRKDKVRLAERRVIPPPAGDPMAARTPPLPLPCRGSRVRESSTSPPSASLW